MQGKGRIVFVAATIAVAVNTEGWREVVGLHIGPSEPETFWSSFLRNLGGAAPGLHPARSRQSSQTLRHPADQHGTKIHSTNPL